MQLAVMDLPMFLDRASRALTVLQKPLSQHGTWTPYPQSAYLEGV